MTKPNATIHQDHGDEGYGAIVGEGAKPLRALEQQLHPTTLAWNELALNSGTWLERAGRRARAGFDRPARARGI